MKDRPILFNSEDVRTILEGRKTQTRRVVKLCHSERASKIEFSSCNEDWNAWRFDLHFPKHIRSVTISCPYGQVGDRLWVRETFAVECCRSVGYYDPPFKDGRPILWQEDDDNGRWWEQCHYRATDSDPALTCDDEDCKQCEKNGEGPHWRPSIHMPRWASRITLEITDIRVERLQEISEEDAGKEGMKAFFSNHPLAFTRSFAEHFEDTWSFTYGSDAWKKNPWVWVIEFKRKDNL